MNNRFAPTMPGAWAAALLLSAALLVPAAAETHMPAPGADLGSLSQSLADGDVIRLEAGRYSGPILVDGKRIAVEGPKSGEAVITPGPANFLVAVQNGGAAELSNLIFEPSAEAPLALYASGAAIGCTGCAVHGSAGRPIYVERGSLTLSGGEVTAANEDAITALDQSTVRLENVVVTAPNGSPLIAENAVSVQIWASRLSGGKAATIFAGQPQVRISGSSMTATGPGSYGLQLQAGGTVQIVWSRIAGQDAGLVAQVEPGGAIEISGSQAVGANTGLIFQQTAEGEPARIQLDSILARATAAGNDAIALRSSGPVVVVDNGSTFISGGNHAAVVTGGAKLRLEGSTLFAVEFGAIISSDGPGEAELVDALAVAGAAVSDRGTADSATERLTRAVAGDAALAEALKAAFAATLATGEIGGLAEIAGQAREVAAELATIAMEVVDGAGQARTVPFALVDLDGKAVAESADGRPVPVKPDFYIVEHLGDASIGADIEVAAAETATVRADVPNGLWLTLKLTDEPAKTVFSRFAAPDRVKSILHSFDNGAAYNSRVFRRLGATDEDIAKGLEAARALIANEMEQPAETDEAGRARYFALSDARRNYALPAIASFGAAADIDYLTGKDGSKATFNQRYIAYFEQRRGTLASGHINRLAEDPATPDDVRANLLALLDSYGVPGADARLLEFALDADRFDALHYSDRETIAERLVRLDDPRAAELMKAKLRRAVERAASGASGDDGIIYDLTAAAAIHLLAFGEPAEKKAIVDALAKAPWWLADTMAGQLAVLAEDPSGLLDLIAESHSDKLRYLCPAYRLRGPAEQEKIYDLILQAAASARARKVEDPADFERQWRLTEHHYRYHLQPCQPAEVNAELAYKKLRPRSSLKEDSGGLWRTHWYAQDATDLTSLMQGKDIPEEASLLLDAVSPAVIDPAWEMAPDGPWSAFREERMALHRAFTRAGDDQTNAWINDGVERRVYVMRHIVEKGFSGAISGHVEVRPTTKDGKLVVGIRLNQRPYYWGIIEDGLGTLLVTGGDRNQWLHQPYVVGGGRKLIERVALNRAGQPVSLVEDGVDADGFFRFKTDLAADDLAGLLLEVDLALFEDRRAFQFDLFASGFARNKEMLQ